MAPLKEIRLRWEGVVFVCRKCMKRAGAEGLRDTLKEGLGRDVRVVRGGCLKVCPKGRVCVVVGGSDGMRCFLARPRGDVETLVTELSRALGREP